MRVESNHRHPGFQLGALPLSYACRMACGGPGSLRACQRTGFALWQGPTLRGPAGDPRSHPRWCWSEQQGSNLRPSAPQADALPGCAMLRCSLVGPVGIEPTTARSQSESATAALRPVPPGRARPARERTPRYLHRPGEGRLELVGTAGFEPATPSSRTRCATRLRYAPKEGFAAPSSRPGPFASGVSHWRSRV